jgi:uncharacterized repeat protein (TIGR01451 family)
LYGNEATGEGGGIYIAAGNPTVKNTIFDANTASDGSAIYGGVGTLGYNDYWPGSASSQVAGGVGVGSGNLQADPAFEDLASRDFHLSADSALIDQAQDGLGVSTDFEGHPRPVNQGPDIGADEYSACLAQVWRGGVAVSQVFGRIGPALDYAAPGDEVRVAEGLCEESITVDQELTLSGSWLEDFSDQVRDDDGHVLLGTTIDALGAARVVTVTNVGDPVTISWVRLTNGSTTGNGGGIRSRADQLTLSDVVIESNAAVNGGGVYVSSGSATLNRVGVGENVASGDGGGVYVSGGVSVDLLEGGISYNEATGSGAGLYSGSGAEVYVSGGTSIGWNRAGGSGGGIYASGSTLTVRNKRVRDNEATGGTGGGVYVSGGGPLELTNVLFYNNVAQGSGGGLYRDGVGSAALYHTNVYRNEATGGSGGGVYNTGSSMVISACIVADNTSGSGADGVQGDANVDVSYTLRWADSYAGVTEGVGNVVADPQFLYSYGAYLDYDSPAIDAVPASASHVDHDAMGDARPQICAKDMGRDEYGVGVREMTWVDAPAPAEAILAPGESFTYTFSLRNDSENWLELADEWTSLGPGTGYTETVVVTLTTSRDWARIVGIEGGGHAEIQPGQLSASVEVGPGGVSDVLVNVTVPPGTFASIEDDDSTKEITTLTYEARQCPGGPSLVSASDPATTFVEENRDFVIAPDNFGAALPGQTVTYTHVITNVGNITDTYSIFPKAGFYALAEIAQPEPARITLTPLQTGTVVISVTINLEAAGGLTDISSAIARSQGDPALQRVAANNTSIGCGSGIRYVSLAGQDSLVDETVGNPDPDAVDYKDNNCTQPGVAACRTIQQAIDQAVSDDLVKIDQGVYTDVLTVTYKGQVISQTAFLNESVTLQGGYDRNNWDEDPPHHISHTTTLDPQGQGRAIYVAEGVTATVDRLVIRNGDAGDMGGGPDEENAGGGLYNEGADLTLHANRIHSTAADLGGGLYHGDGDLLLQNNLLYGTQAITAGGVLYAYEGTVVLQNDTLLGNQAGEDGGGVYVEAAHLAITNTIFATNTAASGGAVYRSASADVPALDYNLYYGNDPNDVQGATITGTHNVLGGPAFMDPGLGSPDLHLRSDSPARDAGDPDTDTVSAIPLDYDNNWRRLGPRVDIGAYEYVVMPGVELITNTDTITNTGAQFTITHTLRNTGDVTDTFFITYTSSEGWADLGAGFPYAIALDAGYTATVPVTITVPLTAGGLTDVTIITATSDVNSAVFDYVVDTTTARSAAWQIGKVVTPAATVQPGERLTYTLILTNSGNLVTVGAYTITDQLPDYTVFAMATPAPITTSPALQWVLSDAVGIGEAITVTFAVTVSQPLTDGTPIVNQVYTVAGGSAHNQPWGAPVTVTVEAPATLTGTKSASTAWVTDTRLVQPGDWLTYTISVTNAAASPGPAFGVVISDALPSGLVYQSMGFVAPATGVVTPAERVLLWQLADPLPVGGSAQVTATARVTSPLAAATVLTNTYGARADNMAVGLSGLLTTTVTATNAITLNKTVEPGSVVLGGVVTYAVVLTNTGNGVPTVALTDALGTAFDPATYVTEVTVPGRTWDTTEGTASVSFAAAAPVTAGVYYNEWVTASWALSQSVIGHVAPITVEAPLVDFAHGTYSVGEGDGAAVVTATLSAPPALTATVDYATGGGTATAGEDYAAASGTLTFTPGVDVQTFTVSITGDELDEDDETVGLDLSNASGAVIAVGGNDPATLTILDDDAAPMVDFTTPTYSVSEDAGPAGVVSATITVTLSAPSGLTVTVDYATGGGTAVAGVDYVTTSGTLTFTPGVVFQTFTVPITDDLEHEYDETVALDLSDAQNATVGGNDPATLVIEDDDAPTVDFAHSTYSVDEGAGPAGAVSATITVTLSSAPGVTVTVDYAAAGGTATAGEDYTATSGILTFTPGVTVQTMVVPIVDDALFEADETVNLSLSDPVALLVGSARNPAVLTIVDDDEAPTVDFAHSTYSVDEGAGPAGAVSATITVTLDALSGVTATVVYGTGGGTASAGADYTAASGALTFTPGVAVQTFAVSIIDDGAYEPDETVVLTLTDSVSATLGSVRNPATLIILNDDSAPTVGFSSSTYSVAEDGGPAIVTVTLGAASGVTATVDYATDDGTATAGTDYAATSGTLTFTPGVVARAFTVPISDDLVYEGDETVTVTLSDPVSATLGSPDSATLTILENDDQPIAGLNAFNDSPTVVGSPTALSATVTAGTNVVYTWAFGDGDTGGGALVAHTYPGVGLYTAVVTASNSANELVATTTVTVTEPPEYTIFLPLVLRNYRRLPLDGPDLVVTDISISPESPGAGQPVTVYVTVMNQGNREVTFGNNFYVDFYVDREPTLLLVGDLGWGAQGSWFGVGETYVFSDTYAGFTSGTHQLYAQADTDDTVLETVEANNVLGPVPLTAVGVSPDGALDAPSLPTPTPGEGAPRPTPTPVPE